VSFIVTDEDGEKAPMNIPLTVVMGKYDPSDPLPEDDGDKAEYVRQQESIGKGAADLYQHGNAASLLYNATKAQGSLRLCVSSTKSEILNSLILKAGGLFN
jgi:hypothetical protein